MALKGEKALRRGRISSSSVPSAITGKGRLDGTFSASPLTSRVSGSEKGTFARGDNRPPQWIHRRVPTANDDWQ